MNHTQLQGRLTFATEFVTDVHGCYSPIKQRELVVNRIRVEHRLSFAVEVTTASGMVTLSVCPVGSRRCRTFSASKRHELKLGDDLSPSNLKINFVSRKNNELCHSSGP